MEDLLNKYISLLFNPPSEEDMESWDARRIRRERVKAIVATVLYGLTSILMICLSYEILSFALFSPDNYIFPFLIVLDVWFVAPSTFILSCEYSELAVQLSQSLDDRLSAAIH